MTPNTNEFVNHAARIAEWMEYEKRLPNMSQVVEHRLVEHHSLSSAFSGYFRENSSREQRQRGRDFFQAQNDIPPASGRVIAQLRWCRLEPCRSNCSSKRLPNAECSICSESLSKASGTNKIDKLLRLPCGHVYHSTCVAPWILLQQCTCPNCRYELLTNNPIYEAGRKIRMKGKKRAYHCICGAGNEARCHTSQCLIGSTLSEY